MAGSVDQPESEPEQTQGYRQGLAYFDAAELQEKLDTIGFVDLDDLGPREVVARYLPGRSASVPEKGGHILHASTLRSARDGRPGSAGEPSNRPIDTEIE